jgi:hypothetical protein
MSWSEQATRADLFDDIFGSHWTMTTTRRQLNTEINAGLDDLNIKARFADLGGMVLTGSPQRT